MTVRDNVNRRRSCERLIEALESRRLFSAAVTGVAVSLTSAFNRTGIVADHTTFSTTSGYDGSGSALSRTLLGTSRTWNGNTYALGSSTGNNVVEAAGQTITLPSATDTTLTLLASGVYGAQASEKFTVTYTDNSTQVFTQSFSDWATSSHFAGESTAISTSYRDLHSGTEQTGTYLVYGYTFTLNSAKMVKSILLPNDNHLDILAIDVTAKPAAAPDTQPPTTPTKLATSSVTATSIALTWTASTDNVAVTGYSIYRNGVFADTVSGDTTTFTDSGLSPKTTYKYDVVALDAAGNKSPASAALSVTTPAAPDTQPPTTPTKLASSNVTAASITLTWTASTDNVAVTGYSIYSNGVIAGTVSGGTTTFTDSGLSPKTTYKYDVVALDAAGNKSPASAVLSVTTLPAPADTQPPTMPTNLGTSTITAGNITLTWTAATDNVAVTGYSIYRNGVLAGTVAGNTTSFPDSGLDPNAAYTYDVVAFDAAGNQSPASTTLAVSTLSTDVPVPPNIPGAWNLSFSDNFNTLDPTIWAQRYWWNGNEGTQAAFDPSQTTISSNGVLSLTAVNKSEVDTSGVTDPYTSGLISTGGIDGVQAPSFSFTYGYVECRTKIAPGQGMWSALWMLPASYQDNYEIDVFENLGRAPTTFQGFVHNVPNFAGATVPLSFNMTAAYHTYGMDWEPNKITWYIDGVAVGSCANTALISQQAMYLMLNLDVGGSWAGPLTAGSPASSSWDVDYLRVWQHPGDSSTGLSSIIPPVNDNFAASTDISGASLTVLSTNVGANKEPGEPNHAGNAGGASVWWTWTAPTSGTLSIDTQGSSFDTLLAVYTGDSITTLTPVPGGSSIGDPTGATAAPSSVSFAVTAGTTYQIAVDGFGGATGQITLNINLS